MVGLLHLHILGFGGVQFFVQDVNYFGSIVLGFGGPQFLNIGAGTLFHIQWRSLLRPLNLPYRPLHNRRQGSTTRTQRSDDGDETQSLQYVNFTLEMHDEDSNPLR